MGATWGGALDRLTLFVVYEFLELSDEVLTEIVDGFVADVR